MSNFSTDIDCQDLQSQFQLSHRKFNRACDQMSLLDQRIKDMQVRYQRAIKNKKNAARYTLRQRLAVMTGVKMMFYEYATAQADTMDTLREKMEDQLYIVRELMGETLPPPPPPWGISETYISKNLIPSAVQISLSALISRVHLPWRAN